MVIPEKVLPTRTPKMSEQQDIEQLTMDCIVKTTQRSRFNQAFMDRDYSDIMAKAKIPIHAWVRQ